MKILVVQDWLRSGGTERQSVFLANAFAAAGHATRLLTFRPGGRLANTVAPAVTHQSLQPFDTRLDWFAPGLTRAVIRYAPDIVLCMGRMANCQGHAIQRALARHLPRSSTIGTMRTGKPLPTWFRRSLRDATHVVANSRDAQMALISRYAVPAEKISVIYNSLVFPARTAADASAGAALRQQHGADPATTTLLCVAMFRPEKNQRELVEIVAGLPRDVRFQLWLAGDGAARRACEQRVAELDLGDVVRFVGFHGNPSALYAAADVAVHASWSESLSNFLIEAQANGLPAVAYEAQGIRECFLPEVTGWAIARDDREAFRTRLLDLARTSEMERQTRAEKARAYARTTFDPAAQVQAYLALFQQLQAH